MNGMSGHMLIHLAISEKKSNYLLVNSQSPRQVSVKSSMIVVYTEVNFHFFTFRHHSHLSYLKFLIKLNHINFEIFLSSTQHINFKSTKTHVYISLPLCTFSPSHKSANLVYVDIA
jgi:hypothetical protein